jgi:hypothetical protein
MLESYSSEMVHVVKLGVLTDDLIAVTTFTPHANYRDVAARGCSFRTYRAVCIY